MLQPGHRVAADKDKALFQSDGFDLRTDDFFYAATVQDNGAFLEKVLIFFHKINGSLGIKGDDAQVAVCQQLVCQGPVNGTDQLGLLRSKPYTVCSVFSLIALAMEPPMSPRPIMAIFIILLLFIVMLPFFG